MVFSSITFLFLYLPLVLALYHIVLFAGQRLALGQRVVVQISNCVLLAASLVFYYWGEKSLVWLFVATTFVDYFCALLIGNKKGRRSSWQRIVLAASICCNLSILFYFKYFTFFGLHTGAVIALPLGISFFTFHSMSYTIDVYRGEVRPTRNFFNYSCYVLMFPQLVAGPIVRFSMVAGALVDRTVTSSKFANGVVLFAMGLGKKVLIANNVSIAADGIFRLPVSQLTAELAWVGLAAYTLQIYFDFSGYSDMAIGLGRMFGFELPANFRYPYVAHSVQEFWRRWHISMSSWFRDYLYLPMGGNRMGTVRTYANLTVVFFLCGLWHGASWTFVAWGLYHGLFLVLERLAKPLPLPRILGYAYTLLVVMGGWVLFRSDTFGNALAFYQALVGLASVVSPYSVRWFVTPDVGLAMAVGVLFAMPIVPVMSRMLARYTATAPVFAVVRMGYTLAILLACTLSLASGTHNPFLYFRF